MKGSVWTNGHSGRYWDTRCHVGSTRIEFLTADEGLSSKEFHTTHLAEIHTFNAFATQGRSHWRAWTGLARSYYELHYLIPCYLFSSHVVTWMMSPNKARILPSNSYCLAKLGVDQRTYTTLARKKLFVRATRALVHIPQLKDALRFCL